MDKAGWVWVAIGVAAVVFFGGYYIAEQSNSASSGSTATATSPTTLATGGFAQNSTPGATPATENASEQGTNTSAALTFEAAYNTYDNTSAAYVASVIVYNISGVSPDIQEFENDFQEAVADTDAQSRLYLAQQGLPLVQEYESKLASNSGKSQSAESALLALNTDAAAIQNPTLRAQALKIAGDANALNSYAGSYQEALEDKWNVIATVFQDIVNEGGGMSSADVELESTSQSVTSDNATLAEFTSNSASAPGSQLQIDYAQFEGLVQSQ